MIKKNTRKRQRGFTLIELIIVIAILAILAVIAIPRFAGFTDRAKIAADEQAGAIVGNAAIILMTGGDLEFIGTNTSGTIVVTYDTTNKVLKYTPADIQVTAQASARQSGVSVDSLLKTMTVDQNLQYYKSITITIKKDGTHSITARSTT